MRTFLPINYYKDIKIKHYRKHECNNKVRNLSASVWMLLSYLCNCPSDLPHTWEVCC